MAIIFRLFIIYLIYLGVKSLLRKFLGPVENDGRVQQKNATRNSKDASQNDVIEAEYREIK